MTKKELAQIKFALILMYKKDKAERLFLKLINSLKKLN